MSPSGGVAEQPVLPANGERTYGVFAQVIGKAAPAILKVGIQIRSAVERILDRFSQPAALVVTCQFFQPTPESGQDRRNFLQTVFMPLFVIVEMFSAIKF